MDHHAFVCLYFVVVIFFRNKLDYHMFIYTCLPIREKTGNTQHSNDK